MSRAKTLADRFGEFFEAIHEGHSPFPWQQRLTQELVVGGWPEALALPTASGKTACIDIAVFALAVQADRPASERTAPRRIFFVVDRRVIVDEAYARATLLANALRTSKEGILHDVACRLRILGGCDEPLACFQLRGGIYRDDGWARTPSQPTVLCSTVDQVGSRLLYRGYGRSYKTWPLHAGLVGNDSLILLDEAHCAKPFMQTAQAVARYREWAEDDGRQASPFHFVVLSATPPPGLPEWTLSDDDRNHAELGRRLKASKPTSLILSKFKTATDGFAKDLTKDAMRLASEGFRRIAVIVNRVRTARLAHERLAASGVGQVVLMIGRMRPLDRDRLMKIWLPRLKAGDDREPMTEPIVVVATQCLEVGANLDFDAMVTECASLDALRQRFGRLNRLGREAKTAAIVVAPSDAEIEGEPDAIYGHALRGTWQWIREWEAADSRGIDFGIDALGTRLDRDPPTMDLSAPAPDAPVMLPSHVDCWVQTAPEPSPTPDVAMFLHGPERGAPDVRVCWRADLDADAVNQEVWTDALALCPPASAECMPVPIHVVRRWLDGAGASGEGFGDVEGAAAPLGMDAASGESSRVVLRWLGPDDSALGRAADLRPGDTVVVPAALGGWDEFGHIPFGPSDPSALADCGDEANFYARAWPVLRLHPATMASWPDHPAKRSLIELAMRGDLPECVGEVDLVQELRGLLRELATADVFPSWLREAARSLAADRDLGRNTHLHPSGWTTMEGRRLPTPGGLVVRASRRIQGLALQGDTFSHEDESASRSAPVPLAEHCTHVAERATEFARRCGLPERLVSDVALAARLHDIGKANRRWQAAMLHGGNPHAARGSLLAKSMRPPGFGRAFLEGCRRCGHPSAWRHEFLSVRLAESAPEILGHAHDRDLVLHLIASHHGQCRPFARVVQDPAPVSVSFEHDGHLLAASSATGLERLDSGVAERFWRLVRQYGWWGLAYLESMVILADYRTSEAEEREDGRSTGSAERNV